MLYNDTKSFFFNFLKEAQATEINARPHLRNAFDFSEFSTKHISPKSNVLETDYTPEKSATLRTKQ